MHELSAILPHGAARRDRVTLATSSSSVSRWLAQGTLVLIHPGVLALAERSGDWLVKARAAVLWSRGPLSHLSALAVHELVATPPGPFHVTVPADRWPRGAAEVVAHRTTLPVRVSRVRGLPVLEPARSLVDAWSWAWSPRATQPPGARPRWCARPSSRLSARTPWMSPTCKPSRRASGCTPDAPP